MNKNNNIFSKISSPLHYQNKYLKNVEIRVKCMMYSK